VSARRHLEKRKTATLAAIVRAKHLKQSND
jgi:hypothetical protein